MQISVIIPALNEKENLVRLVPQLHQILTQLVPINDYEIIIVDGGSTDGTKEVVLPLNLKFIQQKSPGYGGAIKEGFKIATGIWLFTMDADLSHDPRFFHNLWDMRNEAEVIIASRYVQGGKAIMPVSRIILSRILNLFFSHGLSLPIKDMSSGFRLYRKSAVELLSDNLVSHNFDVLEEILIRTHAEGWRICEVPFQYNPRYTGRTHAKLIRFGIAFLRTFYRMWKLRNSIQSADYDARAFNSIIPLQRYWQRKRFAIITKYISEEKIQNIPQTKIYGLDIGCGSSKIISQSQGNIIGLDIQLNKLRYLHLQHHDLTSLPLVNGSILQLPFRNEQFTLIVCSQLIEHLPNTAVWLTEINRILRPGGILILGTPDYQKLSWQVIEYLYRIFAPGGYADEHITHYTLSNLKGLLSNNGFQILDKRYICNAELIMVAIKPSNRVG
ncbi:MAG: glycosyltransferase [bacterium]